VREQCEKLALSNSLVEELKPHDTLMLGVPMYNFGVPFIAPLFANSVS